MLLVQLRRLSSITKGKCTWVGVLRSLDADLISILGTAYSVACESRRFKSEVMFTVLTTFYGTGGVYD